jgi:sulfatase maturation enzyme AslB (radical SAM superfamily)
VLKEHSFLVGISIDGPREPHDFYRVDKGGRPTLDKAMRGLRLLQKHGVEYNIRTTVNRVNGDHPLGVYRFLRDEAGTDWMQFPWASPQDARNAVCGKWCELAHLAHLTTYPTRRLLP